MNALADIVGGFQLGQAQQTSRRRNALAEIAQTQGVESPAFMNALAGLDPAQAYAFQQGNRRMDMQESQFDRRMDMDQQQFEATQEIQRQQLALSRAAAGRAAAGQSRAAAAERRQRFGAMLSAITRLPENQQQAAYAQAYQFAGGIGADLTNAPTPDQWTPQVGILMASSLMGEPVSAPTLTPEEQRQAALVGGGLLPDANTLARAQPAPDARERKIQDTMSTFDVDRRQAIAMVDGYLEATTDAYGNPTTINVAENANARGQSGPPEFYPAPVSPIDPGVNVPSAYGAMDRLGRVADSVADTVAGVRLAPQSSAAATTVDAFNEGLLSEIAAAYGNRPSNWIMQRISQLIPDPNALLNGEGKALDQYTALDNEIRSQVDALSQKLQAPLRPAERVETENTINRLNGVRGRVQGMAQSLQGSARQGTSGAATMPEGLADFGFTPETWAGASERTRQETLRILRGMQQ